MKIGIPKETFEGETRVAIVPEMISILIKKQNDVYVETSAGDKSLFSDEEYKSTGVKIIKKASELYGICDMILKVRPPQMNKMINEVNRLREGSILISALAPHIYPEIIPKIAERKITSFAMEYVPRISRAQSMDALTSMASIIGYKTIIIAAGHLMKLFPLMMTAAGTVPPARVLILGAGVAGLQAIATAKRLGARVEAFDPRPVVKEQVESLGAQFVDMELTEDIETKDGYAKDQSEEFLIKERETIAKRLPKIDVVIATARIFGKPAPLLITEEMVKMMGPGSVIVDITAGMGANCELAQANKVIEKHGVTIYGYSNLETSMPVHASMMYSKNITNLYNHIFGTEDGKPDFGDEITNSTCITRNGEIINEVVKKMIQT